MEIERARLRTTPDGRVTRAGAAEFLGLKVKTLHEWGRLGKGPPVIHISSRCFYSLESLQAFVAAGTRRTAQ
jgi:predicted site-specific integrase-resolvase